MVTLYLIRFTVFHTKHSARTTTFLTMKFFPSQTEVTSAPLEVPNRTGGERRTKVTAVKNYRCIQQQRLCFIRVKITKTTSACFTKHNEEVTAVSGPLYYKNNITTTTFMFRVKSSYRCNRAAVFLAMKKVVNPQVHDSSWCGWASRLYNEKTSALFALYEFPVPNYILHTCV